MKRRILPFSFLIIIAAQLNINLFNSDFKISIAIILFSIFAMVFGKYPVIPITFIVSPGVFISRILMIYVQTNSISGAFNSYAPEIAFYFTYGIFIYIYMNIINFDLSSHSKLIPLIFGDYLANLAEMIFRQGIGAFNLNIQIILLAFAIARTFIIWSFQTAFEYQNFYLLKKEHAERYKNLIFLISKLKSEVLWMDKNTRAIENTMNISYNLYNKLKENKDDPSLSTQALSVAKDIHEIKKEYSLIKRGISEALNDSYINDGMWFKDIIYMLKEKLDIESRLSNKQIKWNIDIPTDFFTTKQYHLLSVLRNLLDNAIEATIEHSNSIKIDLFLKDKLDYWQIIVQDNGKGIKDEYKKLLFTPGFSTKINFNTGVVNRGLGLCHVKDLVENSLHGKISFLSENGYTRFIINLPKSIAEEDNENIHSR